MVQQQLVFHYHVIYSFSTSRGEIVKSIKVLVICLVMPLYLSNCAFFESETNSVLDLDRVAVQCLALGTGIEAGWCTILS